jgi:putative transposase
MEVPLKRMLSKLSITSSKFYDWENRIGLPNRHNGLIPKQHWILEEERDAVIGYFYEHPLDGYRRLSYMMLDHDIAAVSPSTVYRILKEAELIGKRSRKRSLKGTGFVQPLQAHDHWHIDISYINLGGTFYYLCSVLDGFSRVIVHSELGEKMKTSDVEMIIQRAKEKFPGISPRIISDNGPQFVANDFKEFIRLAGMTHVRTSPYYPESNGKIERWHFSLKSEAIRLQAITTVEQARTVIEEYIRYYNEERLHSGIGYISPRDKLEGKAELIHSERDRKMKEAQKFRVDMRSAA